MVTVSGEPQELRLRQFYMPGWRLTLDGEAHPLAADDHFGLIQFRLPEGAHLLQLDYVGTGAQHLAAVISLASIGFCLLVVRFGAPAPRPHLPAAGISGRAALLICGGIIACAVVNRALLQEGAFRLRTADGKPVYMQQAVGATFDETVTLLGYTLASDFVSQSAPLDIRLYWGIEAAPTSEYQPVAQLVDLTVSRAWAVSQPLNFEGGSLSDLAPGQFMSDGHRLKLLDHAPAYVGRISLQLLRKDGTGSFAELPDGSDRYLLPELVPIIGRGEAFRGRSRALDFGSFATLHCIETIRSGDELKGRLHWEVREQPPRDFHYFVHGLSEQGSVLTQSDGAPMAGMYPTSHWRAGQQLESEFSLELVDGVAQVAFGLYDPIGGERVSVLLDGEAVDRILLAPEDASC